MPVLTAQDLHKAYGERRILGAASIAIATGERVGLVGVNGSGKTTLGRILAGLDAADQGTVAPRRDARIEYLAQEPTLDADATPREVVTSGLGAWAAARERYDAATHQLDMGVGDMTSLLEAQASAAAQVERLGGWERSYEVESVLEHLRITGRDRAVGTLSGGERRRVALGRLLVAQPDLAILDEPTNHLDVETIEWLEQRLEESRGALLLITHDRYFLSRVVSRTVEIDRGRLFSYEGGWERYLAAKAERLAHEARAEHNRQRFVTAELDWLRRSPKARTTKQKARIQRAEAAIAGKPRTHREEVQGLTIQGARTGSTLLELQGVTLGYGGNALVSGFDFILEQGQRVGVVGPNGAGKTTLLRAMLGELPVGEGRVVRGKHTRFAYLDQGRGDLEPDASVMENVAGKNTKVFIGGKDVDVRSYLDRFLFDGGDIRKKVGSLSGGERARVALAKMLLQPANVVILDEPTNDLDVTTLSALEQMLLEHEGTAIIVTHDRYMLDRIATQILAFEGEGRVVPYVGNYSTYRALATEARRAAGEEVQASEPAAAAPRRPSKGKSGKGLTYGERLELEGIVDKVSDAERVVSGLEAELADPALYAERGQEVPALRARHTEAKASLDALLARWEELESRKETGSR